MVRQKAGASASGKSWVRAMETWKAAGRFRDAEWTEDMIDQAVDYVHSRASSGGLTDMDNWDTTADDSDEEDRSGKKTGKTKKSTTSKAIGVMQTVGSGDKQEREPCWCYLMHHGPRHVKGCGFRLGKNAAGQYVGNVDYVGYSPARIATITKPENIVSIHRRMEKSPDGEYKALTDDRKREFWTKVMESRKADVEDGLKRLHLCEMVTRPVPQERTDPQESQGVHCQESSDDEDSDEEELPVFQMMTTTFHVGSDALEDETSHATMWKVRVYQEGNAYVGQGTGPQDWGEETMVFPDSGADAAGAAEE